MSLTQRQQHIKDEFTQLHGTWDDMCSAPDCPS
jgi:hypothetical protein